MSLYQNVKGTYGFEKYLSNIRNPDRRRAITKFRISCHNLPIQTGRYNKIKRENRSCYICNTTDIGDELHLMFKCNNTQITDARKAFLSNLYKISPELLNLPEKDRLTYIASCKDENLQIHLGKFLHKCFAIIKQ